MSKLNLIPTVPLDSNGEALAPRSRREYTEEISFYTKPNFAYVNEKVINLGNETKTSVEINFFGKNLTNYVEFNTNLVLNVDDISDQFVGVTSEFYGDSIIGVSTFSLKNLNKSLFKCQVNVSDIESETSEDLEILKVNHDFATAEELLYEYDSTPINIVSTNIVGVGTTTILPSKVYAIRESSSRFKISGSEENALSGIALTFSSVGAGTTHYLYTTNANTRSIIVIDGIIQSPLYRKTDTVGLGTTSIGISTTIIDITGISSVTTSDFILLGDEYLQITGVSTSTSTVTVNRGSMGTVAAAHTNGDSIKLYTGNYNIKKDNIYFSSPPFEGSSFQGRVFYKKLYDTNIVFDDVSNNFTGVGKTFTVKNEFTNIGITTSNTTGIPYGVLLINNIFQKPGVDYDLISNSGVTTVTFTGSTKEDLPKSGKILSYDFYSGSGYQPLVSAAATVSVSAAGTITNVYLTGNGSGYLTTPKVSIYSTIGSGATITALVGTGSSVGFITGFTITNAGIGYTSTSLPVIIVDEPYGYKNLSLIYKSGSGIGTQATVDLVVGTGGSITSVNVRNTGIGYSFGDVLTVSGIGTVSGYSPFTLTVKDTQKDKFSFWTFGKLLRLKITESPNGSLKTFQLLNFENDLTINFENNSFDARFNIEANLLVFIDDVLQPKDKYNLNGNNLILNDPPANGSSISAFIYVASDDDSAETLVDETIKIGDSVEIENQEKRIITKIPTRTSARTSNYIGIGIDDNLDNLRLLDWTKQTRDLQIRGVNFYKTRNSYSPQIRPGSRLIAGIGSTTQSIYVENSYLFDYDGISERETSVEVIEDSTVSKAEAQAIVSVAGTVSSISVTNGGSGYSQTNPPGVVITTKQILKSAIGKNWTLIDEDSSILYNSSFSNETTTVSVGSSLSVRYSYNLSGFYFTTIGTGTTVLNSVSFGDGVWVAVGNSGFISTSTSLTSWNSVGISSIVQDSLPEEITSISFTGNFNDIAYSESEGRFAIVSDQGKIFSYDVTNEELTSRYGDNAILRSSGTSQNLNSVIFDQVYDIGENQIKPQYVAVGNSATILVSASSINNELVGTPGVVWQVKMSDAVSTTGLSSEKLNDIAYTGINTLPFIVVGNNGLVVKFPNNRFDPGNFTIVSSFTTDNLNSVIYDPESERVIVVGASGTAYGSYRSTSFNTWEKISIGSTNFNDIVYSESNRKYLVVGDGKSYTSSYEKVGAAATAVVSTAGTVTSIVISEGGLFYDTSSTNKPSVIIASPPLTRERFNSCKIKGDYGVVVGVSTVSGISTSTPAVKFEIKVDPVLSLVESEIETGDYFATYQTNIGSGIIAITSNGSVVGVATTFIDCVYRADQVTKSATGIVTVISNVSSVSGILTIPSRYEYGIYSWGKIYDFDARESPSSFAAKVSNGSAGLSTSAKVVRVTSIGSTTLPRNA